MSNVKPPDMAKFIVGPNKGALVEVIEYSRQGSEFMGCLCWVVKVFQPVQTVTFSMLTGRTTREGHRECGALIVARDKDLMPIDNPDPPKAEKRGVVTDVWV